MADVSVILEVQDKMTGALNNINNSVNQVTENFTNLNNASNLHNVNVDVTADTNRATQAIEGILNTSDRVSENVKNNFTSAFNNTNSSIHQVTDSVHNLSGATDSLPNDISRADAEVQQMARHTDEVAEHTNNLCGLWGRVIGIMGAYLAGQQMRQAIDYASDLVEVQNVVDVTFAEGAEEVNKWSKSALDAFGLNELSAKRYSSTLGAMMKSSGLAGDEVRKMSMDMTALAGDMASFYNLNGDEAFEKIKSGLSGETEPLKALGINMSDANLQTFAYSQGINKLTKDMSQAEKVQLRYGYLLSVTSDAQGDFARTQDSFSNQTKLLAEKWNAFRGEMATGLLPILTMVIQVMNNMITVAQAVYDFISANWSVFAPLIYGIVGALTIFVTYLTLVKTWSLICASAQAVWNAVMMANPIMLIVMAIMAVIGAIVALCNWIAESTGVTESGLGVITGAFATAGAFIYNLVIGVINAVINAVYNMIKPFASVIEWIVNAFNGGFDNVGDMFLNLIGKLTSWLLDFAKVATKVLDAVFGSDFTSSIEGYQNKLESMGKNKNAVTYKLEAPQLERIDYGSAFEAGASVGDKASNAISDRFSFNANETANLDATTQAVNQNTNAINNGVNSINAKNAKNTSKLKKSVDISKENLVYLRDIAEKEAINQFTTAEVKVDMTNNNTVNNGLDLNGMIKSLSDGVKEAMEVCADGVY